MPVALLLSPLERIARPAEAPVPPAWRLVGGATLAGLGLTLATLFGFDGELLSVTGAGAVVLVLVGAWLSGLSLRFR